MCLRLGTNFCLDKHLYPSTHSLVIMEEARGRRSESWGDVEWYSPCEKIGANCGNIHISVAVKQMSAKYNMATWCKPLCHLPDASRGRSIISDCGSGMAAGVAIGGLKMRTPNSSILSGMCWRRCLPPPHLRRRLVFGLDKKPDLILLFLPRPYLPLPFVLCGLTEEKGPHLMRWLVTQPSWNGLPAEVFRGLSLAVR